MGVVAHRLLGSRTLLQLRGAGNVDRKARTFGAAPEHVQRSTGFGELEAQGQGAQIELRASWSPYDHDLAAHVEGWSELLCMLAGLPPAVEGVSLLSARRVGRE